MLKELVQTALAALQKAETILPEFATHVDRLRQAAHASGDLDQQTDSEVVRHLIRLTGSNKGLTVLPWPPKEPPKDATNPPAGQVETTP
jgi:hypothetical protein